MPKHANVSDLLDRLKEVTEDHQLFKCSDCNRLAYMVDPGDGIRTHFTPQPDGTVLESELE